MGRNFAALGAGIVFGLGLAVSQLVNPKKMLDFLDFTGAWDPTLLVVMVAALAVSMIGFRLATTRPAPVFAGKFALPTRRPLDGRLIGGSAIFGVGWGLIGLCPGPAFASLAFGNGESVYFVVALMAGLGLAQLLDA